MHIKVRQPYSEDTPTYQISRLDFRLKIAQIDKKLKPQLVQNTDRHMAAVRPFTCAQNNSKNDLVIFGLFVGRKFDFGLK